MKKYLITILCYSLSSGVVFSQSQPGEIKGPYVWNSKIFPGTERNYWIYVPRQYDPTKPACSMIVQDGLSRATGWKLPTTLDSLIAARQIPVMIGIFIDHGKVGTAGQDNFPRYNRSFEYDGMGDRYARFLVEEILPEVSRSYNLSTNPNDRSIAGASSGAICAFNAAWERPDQFRRVLSTIGTYVGLRGADEFATLVRKTEPKPLRVFLQDGNHDLNIYAGDWWSANQSMLSALSWNGYEVNHAWGEGGHNSEHTITILAEALIWLWKDYPAAVQTHAGTTPRVNPTVEGETWKQVTTVPSASKLAIDKTGVVFFTDKQSIFRLDDSGVPTRFVSLKGDAGGISWSGDGRLFASDLTNNKLVAIDGKGTVNDLVTGVRCEFLAASANGIYFSETTKNRIGFYSFKSKSTVYFPVPGGPTGLGLSAEQTLLNVGVQNSVFGYSLRVDENGALTAGQDYIHYHIPYGAMTSSVTGMTVDSDNLLYTATAMGVQISDQLGRVNFIFSRPLDGLLDVKLGGKNFDTIYISAGGRLYSRKTTAKGVLSFMPAVKPPRPGM